MSIYQRCWKKRLKLKKFKVDKSKASEDIASQSCVEILHTVDWMVGVKLVPHHKNVCESTTLRNHMFVRFKKITFKSDCPSQVSINNRTTEAVYIYISHGRSWAQFPSRTQNIFLSFSLHIYHSVCQNLNFECVCP